MNKFIFSAFAIWSGNTCLLRIWCGIIFIKYGVSVLHADAMQEFSATIQTANIPVPLLSAYLCKASEFIGGILLIAGFLIRPACFFLIVDMVVATFVFHRARVLNNGMTTFLLLLCLLQFFSGKADRFTMDYFINRKFYSK